MVKESGNVYSYNYTLPEGITGYYFKTYDNYGASTMVPLGADEYPNCITCALKEIVAVPAIIPPLTVSFDSQGGNFIATETYDPNTVSAFHEPVLIGNTFEGWFDNTGVITSYSIHYTKLYDFNIFDSVIHTPVSVLLVPVLSNHPSNVLPINTGS